MSEATTVGSERHPVRLRITDDLRRRRLTATFRPILALPHLLWLALMTVLALAVTIVNWFAPDAPDGLRASPHLLCGSSCRRMPI